MGQPHCALKNDKGLKKQINVASYWAALRFPRGSVVKNQAAVQELQQTWIPSLGQEDHLEEGIATHSSFLAWRIPWTEEPGGLRKVAKSQA